MPIDILPILISRMCAFSLLLRGIVWRKLWGKSVGRAIIIILFALRQLQVIPQIFYSTSQFTMLMLLIYTYPPCVDYSPYRSNVFSKCYRVIASRTLPTLHDTAVRYQLQQGKIIVIIIVNN